ncbi:tRNA-specific adenosine deaminase [Desulfonema limicola]|uniref:tRNA-specific adenosine deaminase n=1 Tax=Desulfonema limicola TaxID=45656 RepID=A0A975B956_9BACT|nr:tRNA adenosine(34) deaminase TadA [Desulfonema limicola]QTA81168.1 tRNA-specific adenosine deaminase [Desulfonema limicola]
MNHEKNMLPALNQALKAFYADEVPVGAVLFSESGRILSSAHNMTITCSDPTAHAEIIALRSASKIIKNYRLLNTSLYVTIEPCIMCMGAIIHARVSRVIFGAPDPKWGAAGSLYDFPSDLRMNHQPVIISGICEEESKKLIQDFFRSKRKLAARKKSDYQSKQY